MDHDANAAVLKGTVCKVEVGVMLRTCEWVEFGTRGRGGEGDDFDARQLYLGHPAD